MAMAGSAIGLGNIWRFPYMVGQYGGAAFILVYILFCFLVSVPIFLSESIIGRRGRMDIVGSMKRLGGGKGWTAAGLLITAAPIVTLSYYSVVGGWSVEYLFKSLAIEFNNTPSEDITSLFGSFITLTWRPVIMHTAFLAAVALIVFGGVKKGIERFTKFTMPVLFVLIIVILAYSVSLPGSSKGVEYLLKPDFSRLTPGAIAAALGQSFYSMSLGIGSILVYSSYIRREENLLSSGVGTAVSDLFFALLAGFAIMPAVFACGVEPDAGPGLVFQTLPFIFNRMGQGAPWISAIVAIVFFVTILVAALTSAISMMEASVAFLVDEKGLHRGKATAIVFVFSWVAGILCSLSFGPLSEFHIFGNTIFDALDKLVSNYLMSFGALVFSLFVGWKMKKEDVMDEIVSGGAAPGNARWKGPVYFMIRYAAPVAIAVIFLTNLLL